MEIHGRKDEAKIVMAMKEHGRVNPVYMSVSGIHYFACSRWVVPEDGESLSIRC